jgi:hypothetical protein
MVQLWRLSMIPVPSSISASSTRQNVQNLFLALLPRIEQHARIYFRDIKCSHRQADKVAETVALAWGWFQRLAERGKDASQFPTVLASLAARAVRSGRQLCGQERANDAMSLRAQQRRGFQVETLPMSLRSTQQSLYGEVDGQRQQDAFEELLRDNTLTPVPDQAAFRIDFPSWLQTLTARERRVVRAMIQNEQTRDLSRRFGVSPGRVSQWRRAFERGWSTFTGDGVWEATNA